MNVDFVDASFADSVAVKQQLLAQARGVIFDVGQLLAARVANGRKIMFCGNGGSAADAQHLAAELVVKLRQPRRPLPGLALTTDTSILTATGNDFGYDEIFARQVTALAQPGDVLIAISTSGNSTNVLRAVTTAAELQMTTIGLTGGDGGQLADLADHAITVPSTDTQRIQEAHILVGHIWMEMLDAELGDGV